MNLTIRVPCVPVGQPRAKATTMGKHTRMYTPATIKNAATGETKPHPIVQFKAQLKHEAALAYRDAPIPKGVPVRVDCCFVFPRRSNMIWKNKPMPRAPHLTKPDVDNAFKAVLDSLTGIILTDDNQVYGSHLTKVYAAGDEQAHVEIVITTMGADHA